LVLNILAEQVVKRFEDDHSESVKDAILVCRLSLCSRQCYQRNARKRTVRQDSQKIAMRDLLLINSRVHGCTELRHFDQGEQAVSRNAPASFDASAFKFNGRTRQRNPCR
jgi:hypothetical protein